jgi:hypothetical protein
VLLLGDRQYAISRIDQPDWWFEIHIEIHNTVEMQLGGGISASGHLINMHVREVYIQAVLLAKKTMLNTYDKLGQGAPVVCIY